MRYSAGKELNRYWVGGRTYLLKSDSVIVTAFYDENSHTAAPWAFSWEFVDKTDYDKNYNNRSTNNQNQPQTIQIDDFWTKLFEV